MEFDWSPVKNAELIERHGIGFERVIIALSEGKLLSDRSHPNRSGRYGHQRQLIVDIDSYAWVIAYVSDGERAFLKTMFPNRKATKRFLERQR